MNSVSRLSLLLALSISALAVAAGQAVAAPKAYVLNYETNSVRVLDTQSNQFVGPEIPVGAGPYSIAITPDGKTAYELNESGESVSVIDLQTSQVVGSPIELGTRPYVIAISPDGKTAYITTSANTVLVLDTQTNQLTGSIPVEGGEASLWGVAFTPDGKTAFVADEGENSVVAIDTQARQIVGAPIPAGEEPNNIAITPDGTKAYVGDEGDGAVSVIDTVTRQPIAAIPVGEEPWGVAITPNGTKAFVVNYASDTVSVIDTQTNQVIGEPIPVGDEPYEVAITPDGHTAYVANYGSASDSVSAIDTQTDSVKTTIPDTGGRPWQVVVAPDQSPTPSFTASQPTPGAPVAFNGSASSDPDGSIAAFDWTFGDGTAAPNGGATPTHQYASPGTYTATLSVTDNEGCSLSLVFTGRTAYCSGGTSLASNSVMVVPSNRIRFGKVTKNKRKGTAKLRVVVPGPGVLRLSGKKVRAVKKRPKKAGKVTLTIRPKAKANKLLKQRHHLKVRIRVTFAPTGGTARTKSKALTLIRKD